MKLSTLFTAAAGFLVGRASADTRPLVMTYGEPAHGTSYAVPYEREVDFLPEADGRAQAWNTFRPRDPEHWAQDVDTQVPVFPRLGRRGWELGAEFLYYLPAGMSVEFQQTVGASELREGPGWVVLHDDPRWGWAVSPVVAARDIPLVLQVPTDDALWMAQQEELYPAGWWEAKADDPIFQIQQPWVAEKGFIYGG